MKFFMLMFITSLTFSAVAFGMSEEKMREKIEQVISQRHPTDTPDWWRSLGPDAPPLIIKMHQQTDHIYKQLRLLEALAWFDDPEAQEFIRNQAMKTKNSVIRNAALRTLAYSQGARAIDFIEPFLKHSDDQTRLASAQALQIILKNEEISSADATNANDLLTEFQNTEPKKWVVDRLQEKYPVSQTERKTPLVNFMVGKWNGKISIDGIDQAMTLEVIQSNSQMIVIKQSPTPLVVQFFDVTEYPLGLKAFVLIKENQMRQRVYFKAEQSSKQFTLEIADKRFIFTKES